MYLFEGLKQKVLEYLPADRVQLVQESFVLAQEAHDGQMRSSGDPYITHPVAVAGILADMHLDHETIMAALLVGGIEKHGTSFNGISAAQFSAKISFYFVRK